MDDVYVMDIFASVGNQFVLTTLAWQNGVSADPTPFDTADALVDTWITSNEPSWLACCPDDYALQGYHCKRVNNTGGPNVITPRPGTLGTFGHGSVISSAGALITAPYYDSGSMKPQWRTARIFVPGVPDTAVSENLFQAAYITALNAFIAALIIPLASSPNLFTYGVWSRKEDAFYSCPDIQLTGKVGTLRKRSKPFI